MKQAPYLLLLVCLLYACGPTHVVVQSNTPPPPPPAPVEEPEVSYQSFYDELSPYGNWIDYPGYGYVWAPSVGYGFQPYATNGHWVPTDMGWTWASDYPWGWAAFHYGRWFYDNGHGWMWMPGQEWAPAWVSWRTSPDYYGWAPLGPNTGFNTGYYNPPANYWCFVPHQYVASPHINNYYVNGSKNVTIINNTTIINNYNVTNVRSSYRGGPAADEVARYSGATVRPVVVRTNNRPGEELNNNQFAIYRPRVSSAPVSNTSGNRAPAPARVQPLREVRPTERPSAPANEPAYNNNQPVNRNNAAAPVTASPSYNNNNGQPVNRPTVEPPRTSRPENQSPSGYNPPAERPNNDNRSRNGQVQQPANARPVNAAPQNGGQVQQSGNARPVNTPQQNNSSLNRPANRPAPGNANSGRPASSNVSNQQRISSAAHPANNSQRPAARPQPAPSTQQRTTAPATNQTQKPQPKPRENTPKPEQER